MTDEAPTSLSRRLATAEALVALIGIGLIVLAVAATQRWLDAHMLPSFFVLRRWYVLLESAARIALAMMGVLLLLVARRRIARLAAQRPSTLAAAAIAALLAIAAGQLALTWLRPSSQWLFATIEPLRRPDPRLGWTFVPHREAQKIVGGRTVSFAFDAAGYRVRRVDEPVDPARPTVLFAGESVMVGEGLNWDETIPAQVGALLGVQSANLAVHGYASDQAYLRLEAELPRFQRPVAVVTLFMTALLGRNLDDNRPHLGPGLVWLPAVPHARLMSLATLIVPYRREETVERGIGVTRDVLRATAALATARGAASLVVVPQFDREDEHDRMLRRRILDDAGLPYLFVEFDDGWRIPGDLHPNAPTARRIALAVADRLRSRHQLLVAQPLFQHAEDPRHVGRCPLLADRGALLRQQRQLADRLAAERRRVERDQPFDLVVREMLRVHADHLVMEPPGAVECLRELGREHLLDDGDEPLGDVRPALADVVDHRGRDQVRHLHAERIGAGDLEERLDVGAVRGISVLRARGSSRRQHDERRDGAGSQRQGHRPSTGALSHTALSAPSRGCTLRRGR
jgi:hypothetical protein